MATAKLLDDIMECPICTEVYTDPRVLPCVHTYCLKCIKEWSKDKQPGDELACPLCRKEFTLPSNGIEALPRNFFIANFLQLKQLSSVESKMSPCEVCSDDVESESDIQNMASVYCIECQLKLCKKCERGHKVIKSTRSHKVIGIGDEQNLEALFETLPPSYCDQHKDEYLKIYCIDCKLVICMMCYIRSHTSHKCSDIDTVADDFRKQITSDVDNVAARVDKCREMLDSLEKEKNEFIEQVEKTGVEISEKAEQLKQMIDVHKEELMNELSSMKQKRMKEIESLQEEIERQLLSMESYKKYVDEVRQKGTACDIARAASSLHDRADELLKFDVIERTLADLGHADVTFTSSDFVTDDACSVGQLTLNIVKSPGGSVSENTHRLVHVIPSGGRARYAVASLGDEVFVSSYNSHQIEVYSADTFTLQHCLVVPGLGACCYGLAACIRNNCLYASDHSNNSIHRVDLSDSNAVKTWSVGSNPAGLSVTNAHNVVVTCCKANKLQEYTTRGGLVTEISLQQTDFTSPWHAVQLSTGDYVVSHAMSPGMISVVGVGVDGEVICSYDLSQTSSVGQMKYPRSLAVTKNDDILVADADNNRILSMNSSVSSVQVLALSVRDGVQGPWGLYLDESRGRLYVSEWGCRVLVFESVAVNH